MQKIKDLCVKSFPHIFMLVQLLIILIGVCMISQVINSKEITGTAEIVAVNKSVKSVGLVFSRSETNYFTTLKYKGKSYTARDRNSYLLSKEHEGEVAKVKVRVSKKILRDQVVVKRITVTGVNLKK